MDPAALVLFGTNVASLGLVVVLFFRLRRRCVHEMSPWSMWILSQDGTWASFVRTRFCIICGVSDQSEVGRHRCWPCKHRDEFIASFDSGTRIMDLEKKLGL
jgi:hypothetical protein